MNLVLFKANFKSNLGILIFITLMLLMYTTIAVGMFDPDSAESFEGMMKMLPEGMVKAFGFEGIGTEITGYLANYLYGFIYLTFPVIFIVVVANSLVAKHVDSGSMTYLLTTPNTRKKIATTQAVFLISTTLAIIIVNAGVAILMAQVMFSGLLNVGPYIMLNLVTFGCLYVIGSLTFFFSCLFNDAKNSMSVGAAIPVLFIVIKMVGAISEDLSFLKYFSLFSLIDTAEILSNNTYNVMVIIGTLLAGTIIYLASIIMFDKRSLSI